MTSELVSLITQIKVSSTLDKSVGKKHLVDGSPETCWTSQQGLPQFIQLSFEKAVVPKRISIVFQGGFVGTSCTVLVPLPSGEWQNITNIYPDDVNRRQAFDLHPIGSESTGITTIKLLFEESSDFFGRVTIYDLNIEGLVVA
ncbi:hypothetical protein AGABI2DRAFT_189535 [Agaricus bisporus var. bisporus H97]|uniref:hypothetical protein n=1 Tax=Agaricus bisporus var. bisporus (strain H97 / ATCC MYA-4626 / FGSC 10389) TaxID=936046 RepID=UPI00029F7EA3|nr:hypothetical protein AGABI2DRAFT_189535 [Agaricus bisporus var. bisporus H97]EKV51279.1 hypothetical protein AGABI2DRAFT_189535 [Agaricus bisporus var. bisporus H97]